MKALIIAIVLGALGYYIFIYEPDENVQQNETVQTENQKIRDELGIESKSYQGAMIETYHKYKGAIQGAKDAVKSVESIY